VNADGTIVVIGGSSGIGLAVARRSLADGATVVIAGRSQQRLDAARAELARTELAQTVLHAEGAQILV
jgi:NAD(P)-dependent dehydrogenase (short-subunit alcohol dehydrogenase family)